MKLRRRSASHRSKWLPLLLWLGTFAGVLLLAGSSLGAEPASQTFTSCDGAAAPAAVMAEFDVSAGSDLFLHFPALGITPEISDPSGPLHNGPLHVRAIRGPVCNLPVFVPLGPAGTAPKAGNLILVTRPDGDLWVFGYGDFSTYVP